MVKRTIRDNAENGMANVSLNADAATRARAALAWWLGELRSLYEDATRVIPVLARGTLTIEAGERRWLVRRQQIVLGEISQNEWEADASLHRLQELIATAGRIGKIILVLPSDRVLTRTIDLPSAAQGELERVVSFEIVRQFPLSAERMYYRYRVVGQSKSGSKVTGAPLSVEIVAVPRDDIVAIIDRLTAVGLPPNRVAIGSDGGPLFLPREALPAATQSPRALRIAMALLVLGAVGATTSWPVAQQVRLAALEREIAGLKPQAEAALRIRQARLTYADQASAVARLRAERAPLMDVLDILTRELPDGAWLTSLSISGRDVVLDGLASSAAALAVALGRNPRIDGVVYRAPITRDVSSGLEHFQFSAKFKEIRQ